MSLRCSLIYHRYDIVIDKIVQKNYLFFKHLRFLPARRQMQVLLPFFLHWRKIFIEKELQMPLQRPRRQTSLLVDRQVQERLPFRCSKWRIFQIYLRLKNLSSLISENKLFFSYSITLFFIKRFSGLWMSVNSSDQF